jgi:type VI secretion system protein ImpF
MPSDPRKSAVTLSLLDRLADLNPDSTREIPRSSWGDEREFRDSLREDLAALLNTRRAEEDFDSAFFEESANSLLTFGVTDFTSYNLKAATEQERVRRSIERAIRQFEPRLTRVAVSVEKPDPLRPVLQFQIAATWRTGLPGEAVLFNATLHRDTRRIAVSGGEP